jgi:hypothetical protein
MTDGIPHVALWVQVQSIGYVGTPRTWYFRVQWLRLKATPWGKISTNLFSEDLADFEMYERPESW